MAFYGVLAVGLGAAIGAWLRWTLATMNPLVGGLPLGTLAANLIGGYLVGLAVAYFADHTGIAPEMRLFVITGFLGGLTTFSTFSAEAVTLLMRAQYGWACVQIFSHLAGSLLLTVLGMQTYKWFAQS
jgi:fluoride exporter